MTSVTLRLPGWRSTLGVILLAFGSQVSAQSVSTAGGAADTLDLASALRLASRSSPALQRVAAEAGVAAGELRTTGQWPNPTLEYRRENIGAPLQPDEFVTAYVPIDVTGRRQALRRATSRGRERVHATREAALRDVELQIARAWTAAALSADISRSVSEQYQAVERIAAIEAQRAAEGVVAEAVAMRTRVEANRISHELALAETRAMRDRLDLAALLGVTDEALPPLPSVLTPALRTNAETRSAAQLVTVAQSGRPEILAASLWRDESVLRQRVESGGVVGDWQLQGGTKRTSGFMSGQLGLAVPLPIFNQNSGARERSASAVLLAETAYREVELRIRADVLAATDNLRRLESIAPRFSDAIRLGREIASSARVAYAEGHMTLLELLDAERTAADARNSASRYRADLLLAQLTLRRVIGAPLVPEISP